jgi:hypothetical protein
LLSMTVLSTIGSISADIGTALVGNAEIFESLKIYSCSSVSILLPSSNSKKLPSSIIR